MATKNNPGAFDCYANAAPDEPMFVLLGRDPMAGRLVRTWAAFREAHGEDPAKVAEARRCAAALDDWARGLGKVPTGTMADIDWSKIDESTCHCLCGAVFRTRAKYSMAANGLITETPCPTCGDAQSLFKVSSDPETMTLRGSLK